MQKGCHIPSTEVFASPGDLLTAQVLTSPLQWKRWARAAKKEVQTTGNGLCTRSSQERVTGDGEDYIGNASMSPEKTRHPRFPSRPSEGTPVCKLPHEICHCGVAAVYALIGT